MRMTVNIQHALYAIALHIFVFLKLLFGPLFYRALVVHYYNNFFLSPAWRPLVIKNYPSILIDLFFSHYLPLCVLYG